MSTTRRALCSTGRRLCTALVARTLSTSCSKAITSPTVSGDCSSDTDPAPGEPISGVRVPGGVVSGVRAPGTGISTSDTSGDAIQGGGGDDSVMQGDQLKSLSLPTVNLPSTLQRALDITLSGHPSRRLTDDGRAMSQYLELRQLGPPGQSVEGCDGENVSEESVIRYGKREVIAYAASRLPATYGVTLRVFNEISQREPSFRPGTLLDFGSGLGSAVWAAYQTWGNSLYEYCCIDTSQEMCEVAARLQRGGEKPDPEMEGGSGDMEPGGVAKAAVPGVHFRQYLPVSNKVKYDVVVSAYTLGDLPSIKLKRMSLASLWRKTLGFLVLIEPGNWSGYEAIMEARDMSLNATHWDSDESEVDGNLEGHVFAPCPHDLSCPLREASKQPCHFAQRVQLAHSEREVLKHKACRIENFSYIVLRKGPRKTPTKEGRLLQPVKKRTRHIICQLCCPNGNSEQMILTKGKHKEVYKCVRRMQWGDLVPWPAEKCR